MSRRRSPRIFLVSRIARLLACTTLALVAFVATPSAGRAPVSRFDALPRPDERLAQPIWLPALRHADRRVAHHRGAARGDDADATRRWPPSTTPAATPSSATATSSARRGSRASTRSPRSCPPSRCSRATRCSTGSRRARSTTSRRASRRSRRAAATGASTSTRSTTSSSATIRSSRTPDGLLVANPRFVRTLTHEISHVLSARLGVWDAIGYDRQHDEDLAEEFVSYMGMHFPAESSAEDLAYHRGRIPRVVAERRATDEAGNASRPPRRTPARSAEAAVPSRAMPVRTRLLVAALALAVSGCASHAPEPLSAPPAPPPPVLATASTTPPAPPPPAAASASGRTREADVLARVAPAHRSAHAHRPDAGAHGAGRPGLRRRRRRRRGEPQRRHDRRTPRTRPPSSSRSRSSPTPTSRVGSSST